MRKKVQKNGDFFNVTELFERWWYLAEQMISVKFIFISQPCSECVTTLLKIMQYNCKAFIHGSCREMQKRVLSGELEIFSICYGRN